MGSGSVNIFSGKDNRCQGKNIRRVVICKQVTACRSLDSANGKSLHALTNGKTSGVLALSRREIWGSVKPCEVESTVKMKIPKF